MGKREGEHNSSQEELKPVICRNPKGVLAEKRRPKTTVIKCMKNLGQNEWEMNYPCANLRKLSPFFKSGFLRALVNWTAAFTLFSD